MAASPNTVSARLAALVGALVGALVSGCGVDETLPEQGWSPESVGFDAEARAELENKRLDRYFGSYQPSESDQGNEQIIYTFEPDPEGPICIEGGPFRVGVRDTGSQDLLIYLQGGGACWSDLCAAQTTANGLIPPVGFTDGNVELNVLGGFNVLFVSYCDGSVFTGDGEVDDPAHGAPDGKRYHHGLKNLSAALDLAVEHFPEPRRVVLSGSSAGGYGTLIGTALTRLAYPDSRLFVINDAGLGLTNPEDPTILQSAAEEWNFTQYVPDSCSDCMRQFTSLIGWGLEHDPSLKVAAFTAYEDVVIGGVFLGMSGPDFKRVVVEETGKIHHAYPERFQRFFIAGGSHTVLMSGYYETTIDGVSFADWVRAMVEDRADWQDRLAADDTE